jgi:hypothetical protein
MTTIRLAIILVFIFLFADCHKVTKPRIEKFIWIRHNANWINDTSELKARIIIIYNDSSKDVTLSKHYNLSREDEFFKTKASDTLINLIYNNLESKKYHHEYEVAYDPNKPPRIYDGDIYLLIYKFSNQQEKYINYISEELPDSLNVLATYIEKLSNKKLFDKGEPYDMDALFKQYKNFYLQYRINLPPHFKD